MRELPTHPRFTERILRVKSDRLETEVPELANEIEDLVRLAKAGIARAQGAQLGLSLTDEQAVRLYDGT